MTEWTTHTARAKDWFEALRTRICTAFEAIEREAGSDAAFEYTPWSREEAGNPNPGGGVRGVALDRRGSWSIALANGIEVVLGRNDPQARLARFAPLLPRLLADHGGRRLVRADLRYTNGFALVWGEVMKPAAPAPAAMPPLPQPVAAAPRGRSLQQGLS